MSCDSRSALILHYIYKLY